MNTLTRYILREIIHYFLIFLLAMIAIFIVYQIHDTKSEFLDNSPGLKDIVLFLLFTIPGNLKETMPFVCWLATCFAYGILAKNKEILAMAAAGVSFPTLARPAIYFGIIVSILFFVFNQTVVPYTQEKAHQIEKGSFSGKDLDTLAQTHNLFVKGVGNRFYIIERYNTVSKTMEFPILLEASADGSSLTSRLQADAGHFISDAKGGGALWQFDGAERWDFKNGLGIVRDQQFTRPLQVQMEENLDKFLAKPKKIDDMNLRELTEARSLKIQTGRSDYKDIDFAIQSAAALPASCLLLALVGFVVVTDVKSHKLVYLGTIGLLMASGYYVLNVVGRKAGEFGFVPAYAAAWFALAAYSLVILAMFKRLNAIR